jgi:hypothetical protein
LESGSSISFSGKEIEIMEEIQREAVAAFKQAAVDEKSNLKNLEYFKIIFNLVSVTN